MPMENLFNKKLAASPMIEIISQLSSNTTNDNHHRVTTAMPTSMPPHPLLATTQGTIRRITKLHATTAAIKEKKTIENIIEITG
uniref:Uncharacterized protein n=1 Tax=Bracon brevicornis TaxID=1563983 RepID=A0A6V7J6G6_9HYME